ncbi:hypothetical protein CBOM_07902 [Ceraceosorus bombacis]|uniref:Uncharacterized protein n=1 Tax=Ceraceosorus bombacis TaxID=401625 RepID=A0A0P1BQG4_9BASI|nr:hypothetical protein CBOM_07902 [Ceraceosorus bombacis]
MLRSWVIYKDDGQSRDAAKPYQHHALRSHISNKLILVHNHMISTRSNHLVSSIVQNPLPPVTVKVLRIERPNEL